MRLSPVEQSLWQEAEAARERALRYLERGESLVTLSQHVRAASEHFDHLAALLAERARVKGAA